MSIAMPPVPCTENPPLFDSVTPWDHREAKSICATCPVVQACILRATAIASEHSTDSPHRGPWGTWGGLLWVAGSIYDGRSASTEVAA